ncbi:MAG: class I SAM-dependent methyltransferase [Acidobacteriota bacterium]
MKQHWDDVYRSKLPHQVSWYRPHLERSIAMIEHASGGERGMSIVDVGGGASTLVDDLLVLGYRRVTVLDIAEDALNATRTRLGEVTENVQFVCADLLHCGLRSHSYDIWHDRAVFHFLTQPEERAKYAGQMERILRRGGHAILATFGPEGPNRCSGLDTMRYDAAALQEQLGPRFELVESAMELHETPFATAQQFQYCHFVLHN